MANLLSLGNSTLDAAAAIKINIDDSGEDFQSGGRVSFPISVANNQTVATLLTVDVLPAGRVRWNIAGQHGAWHSTAGTFCESITASADGYAALEYAPFTVASIDYSSLSVG